MAAPEVQYLSSGDTALTVQFGTVIERELDSRIVALGHSIAKAAIPGVSVGGRCSSGGGRGIQGLLNSILWATV